MKFLSEIIICSNAQSANEAASKSSEATQHADDMTKKTAGAMTSIKDSITNTIVVKKAITVPMPTPINTNPSSIIFTTPFFRRAYFAYFESKINKKSEKSVYKKT